MQKIIATLILTLLLLPVGSSYAGFGISGPQFSGSTDSATMQLVSYYDLRDRETLVQVSNIESEDIAIHVQIFQNDQEGCPEINFYDTLTPNDTHIYDLNNLSGNANPGVNIVLPDGSNGFVVITAVESPTNGSPAISENVLIGNFRIIDASGYEYRTNSTGFPVTQFISDQIRYTINFNQLGGNNFSDIVGIQLNRAGFIGNPSSVDNGFARYGAFVYNDAENATSCDFVEFVCGGSFVGRSQISNVADTDLLNYGINDIFPSTNGDNLICQGNQDTSGFVELIGSDFGFIGENGEGSPFFVGFAGLNNGNGTGSMDSWVGNDLGICEFFPDGDCPFDLDING